jgi:hypothetical protein
LSQLLNPVSQRPARLDGTDDWLVSAMTGYVLKHLHNLSLLCRPSGLWQTTSQLAYQSQDARKKLYSCLISAVWIQIKTSEQGMDKMVFLQKREKPQAQRVP